MRKPKPISSCHESSEQSLLFGAKEKLGFRRDKETRMFTIVMDAKVFADKFSLVDESAGYIWHLDGRSNIRSSVRFPFLSPVSRIFV